MQRFRRPEPYSQTMNKKHKKYMNKTPYIVAVEIGSSKIKGAVGLVDRAGTLIVKCIEEEQLLPNNVRYGCVHNIKEVANQLNQVIGKLNASIKPAVVQAVYVGVGGRSLKSQGATVSNSFSDDREVTPEMVAGMLKRVNVSDPDSECLAVVPVEFMVNGKSQGVDPVGLLAKTLSAKVNVVTCRSQILRNLQLSVNEKLDLPINGYVVRPMALADLVLTGDEKRLGTMLVDCGAETTTVAIYKGGVLVYLATIPLGSRHITRDLMNISALEERADEIKRTIGDAHPDENRRCETTDEIDTSKINTIVVARASEIVANISAQIEYAGLNVTDLRGGIVVVGGGSMLKGFAETLARNAGLNVRRGTLPASVRMGGSKISTTEDLDVISVLRHLASLGGTLQPCTFEPEPEPDAAAASSTAADGNDTESDYDDDDFGDIEEPGKRIGIFSRLKKGLLNLGNPGTLDTFDD